MAESELTLLCVACGHLESEPFDVGDGCPMCGEPMVDSTFADSE